MGYGDRGLALGVEKGDIGCGHLRWLIVDDYHNHHHLNRITGTPSHSNRGCPGDQALVHLWYCGTVQT